MSNNIDKIGEKAAKLLGEIADAKHSAKQTREGNKRRVEELRPLLQQVWDAFNAKQTVQGSSTKKEWVEENTTVSLRNCQYILKGGNKNRPDAKRFTMLKPGTKVKVGGREFKLTKEMIDAVLTLAPERRFNDKQKAQMLCAENKVWRAESEAAQVTVVLTECPAEPVSE